MVEPRRSRRPWPRREDLPEELHPLFDQLTLEIHRAADAADTVRRLRFYSWVTLGMLISATLINIVPTILRAI